MGLRPTPRPRRKRAGRPDPEHEALIADAVGLAPLVVLETPAPAERLVFVLHEVFGVPFEEIALMVGRSPATARQRPGGARRWARRRAGRSRSSASRIMGGGIVELDILADPARLDRQKLAVFGD
jgi:DNA-directed RNA polymerase specialized sigma24 family protein